MSRADDALAILRRHFAAHRPDRRRPRGRWRRLGAGLREGLAQVAEPLTRGWLASLAGAVGACLLVWFLGPLVSLWGWRPLEAEGPRLGGVLGLMVAWGLLNQLRQLRERTANQRLVDALTEAGELAPDAPPRATAARAAPPDDDLEPGFAPAGPGVVELEGLRRTLGDALDAYGRRWGERSLRRLPWYLVIGAPGTGKTTALANSDLTFPLEDILGDRTIRGVAGTRSCDWWFTSEAVLVDTAGRYTSQDSDRLADSAAWLGLLDLLKEHRPSQPINGVVVAVSLEDLATQPVIGRHVMAEAIYDRLAEIDARLGVRLPVYVMLTKSDRLAGFSEMFDGLDDQERQQVWGMTFEDDGAGPGLGWNSLFAGHFERLLARLEQRALERLDHESDPLKRALIAGFPQQFASMRAVLAEFLTLVIEPGGQGRHFNPRGVYFTSAKRMGIPLDRLAPEIASGFGLEQPLRAPQSGAQEGLFLTRLFRDVVFAEAHLAARGDGPVDGVSRRRRWAVLAILAVVAALAGMWLRAWVVNHALLGAFAEDVAVVSTLLPEGLGGGSTDEVADGDVETVLPALTALRALPAERSFPNGGLAVAGLGKGGQLGRAAEGLYQRALRRLLLPRLMVRLERVITGPEAQTPEWLYDTLRVYLMLDGEAPLDRFTVTRWFSADWIATLPGPDRESERRQMAEHLSALLDGEPPSLPGSVLVEDEARRKLSDHTQADHGYGLVRELPAVRSLPPWRPLERTGAATGLVLVRASGKSLADPMAGLYTADGARQTVLPAIGRVAVEVAQEGWVLGLPMDPVSVAARARQLRQDITARYFDDYARQWREFLADLTVTPAGMIPQLLTVLSAASGPASPLPPLIAAVVRETRVAPPEATRALKAGPPGRTPAASLGLAAGSTVVTTIQPASGDDDPASWWPAAAEVGARFQSLQVLSLPGTPQSPSPLTNALSGLADLQRALARWSSLPPGKPGGTATAAHREAQAEVRRAAERLKTLATPLPPPVSGWFVALADACGRVLPGAPR